MYPNTKRTHADAEREREREREREKQQREHVLSQVLQDAPRFFGGLPSQAVDENSAKQGRTRIYHNIMDYHEIL